MKKPKQFEFAIAEESFSLITQTTVDGDRLQHEADQREADQAASAALQTSFLPQPQNP